MVKLPAHSLQRERPYLLQVIDLIGSGGVIRNYRNMIYHEIFFDRQ